MKKSIFLVFTTLIITILSTSILAVEDLGNAVPMDQIIQMDKENEEISDVINEEKINTNENDEKIESNEAEVIKNDEPEELKGASKEIIEGVNERDRKIASLTQKYNNNRGIATVAYYLEQVRSYSTPIFFIFLTIGAFNFFIIGNKKLDKKEQGFSWITACLIGWVFFQCVPLIFALFTL